MHLEGLRSGAPGLLLEIQQCVQKLDAINRLAAERDQLRNWHAASVSTLSEPEGRRVCQQIDALDRRISALMGEFPAVKGRLRAFVKELERLFDSTPFWADKLANLSERMRKLELLERGGPAMPDLSWGADFRDMATILTRLDEAIELIKDYEGALMQEEAAQTRRALLEELAKRQNDNPNGYLSIGDLSSGLGLNPDWVLRQFKILKEQGRVKLNEAHTSTSVQMTARGWESLERPETVSPPSTTLSPSTNYYLVNSPGANIATIQHSPGSSVGQSSVHSDLYDQIVHALDQLVAAIRQDPEIGAEEKQDATDDADRLKAEIRRAKPDQESVWKWFDRLSKVGAVAKLVECASTHLPLLRELLHRLLG